MKPMAALVVTLAVLLGGCGREEVPAGNQPHFVDYPWAVIEAYQDMREAEVAAEERPSPWNDSARSSEPDLATAEQSRKWLRALGVQMNAERTREAFIEICRLYRLDPADVEECIPRDPILGKLSVR